MPVLSSFADDVIRSLATPGVVSLERTNTTGGSNGEGSFVPGSKSTRVLPPTVVHPISGSQRVLLPEGVRNRETIVTYSTELLRTETEFGPEADVIIHRPFGSSEDERYIVQTAENWGHVSGHWRVFSTREAKG